MQLSYANNNNNNNSPQQHKKTPRRHARALTTCYTNCRTANIPTQYTYAWYIKACDCCTALDHARTLPANSGPTNRPPPTPTTNTKKHAQHTQQTYRRCRCSLTRLFTLLFPLDRYRFTVLAAPDDFRHRKSVCPARHVDVLILAHGHRWWRAFDVQNVWRDCVDDVASSVKRWTWEYGVGVGGDGVRRYLWKWRLLLDALSLSLRISSRSVRVSYCVGCKRAGANVNARLLEYYVNVCIVYTSISYS